MTELADLVEAYKREVSGPGMFDTDFPLASDGDLEARLADAFAEAQLDGHFRRFDLDLDALTISPDLSTAGAALVIVYAGIRLLRQRISAQSMRRRAWAGPVGVDSSDSAMVTAELLREMERRKDRLLRGSGGPTVFQLDAYATRGRSHGGFYPGEVA